MDEKTLIATKAAARIRSGMVVGLGTGSTANLFIDALAKRVQSENLAVRVVSSSIVSAIKARQCALELIAIEQLDGLDVYVDGADEVAPDLTLLKGRGSDLVCEKLLARAAKEFWVLADSSKSVSRIGEKFPLPVEVMPFAWQLVKASLSVMGGIGELRPNAKQDGLHVTSHGSLVLDLHFENQIDIQTLDLSLSNTPGVVEHGIFFGLASELISADD